MVSHIAGLLQCPVPVDRAESHQVLLRSDVRISSRLGRVQVDGAIDPLVIAIAPLIVAIAPLILAIAPSS